jgi:hypothetical protein
MVPLAGFVATWLLAMGFSLSNIDIRSQVEAVGLLVLGLWPVIGLLLTRRAGFVPTGTPVRYCDALQPQFKSRLLQRLRREP